jgi:hypothetical protein
VINLAAVFPIITFPISAVSIANKGTAASLFTRDSQQKSPSFAPAGSSGGSRRQLSFFTLFMTCGIEALIFQ